MPAMRSLFCFLLLASAALAAKDKPCQLDKKSWTFKSECAALVPSRCDAAMAEAKAIAIEHYYRADVAGDTLYLSARPKLTHKLMMGVFAPERHTAIRFVEQGGECRLAASGSAGLAKDILKGLKARPLPSSGKKTYQPAKPSADPNADSALDRSGRIRQ